MTTAILTRIRYAFPMNARDTHTMTDEKLMARIAERDEAAFAEFCRRYLRWAYRFDMRFLQNQQDAEDAVQEKFMRIWRKADEFRPLAGSRVTNYLLKIDKNICLDMIRRSYRKRETGMSCDAAVEITDETSLLEYLAYCQRVRDGNTGEADRRHEAVELAEQIFEFTQRQFKQIQFLIFWGFVTGMSYREIAATYDVSIGSVRGYVARSFSSIRSEFSKARTGHEQS